MRDAEVGEHGLGRGAVRGGAQQHVGGLDVAVHDSPGVHGRQGRGELGEHGADLVAVEVTGIHAVAQRRPVDELHDQEGGLAGFDVRVVQRHQRRVTERREDLGLGRTAQGVRTVLRAVGGEELDGDVAGQQLVAGTVDAGHATGADALDEPVAAGEQFAGAG